MTALPSLRLALADLTPRETDKVASCVAGLYGGDQLGALAQYQTTENEMEFNRRLSQLVLETLVNDGLAHWIEDGNE